MLNEKINSPTIHPLAASPPANPWLAAATLCLREWVRFIRQRNRIFGALGQPVLFWLLFGAGLGPSFQWAGASGISYREYFFPGTLVLILLFTAIFATISVIEDRREGFLQGVLVSPAPRWSIVAGKVLGGALIAVAHAAVFLALGFTLDLHLSAGTVLLSIGCLFVIALALTALGLAIAWPMRSTQGFHAVMSVFLLPMWLLSGAFFPPGDNWLGWIIRLNPLTYCVALQRHILYAGVPAAARDSALASLPPPYTCAAVTLGFVVVTFVLAWRVAAVRTSGDAA